VKSGSQTQLDLLKAEKELTRRSRGKNCRGFGSTRIIDSRRARVSPKGARRSFFYHFMFGPRFKAGCPTRSLIADRFNGIAIRPANDKVMLWAVSSTPLTELRAYKKRTGWTFPVASSASGDFNFNFSLHTPKSNHPEGIEYNSYREPESRGAQTRKVATRMLLK
jgi:predicted dithiol-disulfide oxidoreductase (DUF899 family)